jgi:hypothetical protein
MKRRPRASRLIKIASPACDARPNERCASGRYPSGLWLTDLPPKLSTGRNAPRLTWQSRPVAGPDLLAYVYACWLFALIGIDMAATCTQRKQYATSPLSNCRVWQAG